MRRLKLHHLPGAQQPAPGWSVAFQPLLQSDRAPNSQFLHGRKHYDHSLAPARVPGNSLPLL